MKIAVLGPQGSGKSTQADFLSQNYHLPHLSTGDIFRQISQTQTDLGRKIMDLLSKGQLVPDEIAIHIVSNLLQQSNFQNGFILDGFPRNLKQAEDFPVSFDKVFYINISDEEAQKRLLLRGRSDDTPAIIEERLRLYHHETEPILAYYRKMGILEDINGMDTIEKVNEQIKGRMSQ